MKKALLLIHPAYFLFKILIAMSLFFSIKSTQAQSVTSLPDIQVCPKENFNIPINISSLVSVDSFQLVFSYNQAVATYVGYNYLHPGLLGTRFVLEQQPGKVSMYLKKGSVLNFGDGILIDFIFRASSEQTALSWDTAVSGYYFDNNSLNANFVNGSIQVYPRVRFSLEQVPEEVCPRDTINTASMIARISGGLPPYSYQWIGRPMQVLSDSIAAKLYSGINYTLRITDANSCLFDTTFQVKTRKINNIIITASPDTVFLHNPTITFTVENKSDPFIISYYWKFGDLDSASTAFPTVIHVYDGVKEYVKQGGTQYEVKLRIVNEYGCDTTYSKTLVINETKLFIPNVFTPNNDLANDVFKIVPEDKKDKIISYEYVKLELAIYNRWGRRVYYNADYKSDWDGDNLPDGVYFYVLMAHGLFKTDTHRGVVHIMR